jgi:hypothetical protein
VEERARPTAVSNTHRHRGIQVVVVTETLYCQLTGNGELSEIVQPVRLAKKNASGIRPAATSGCAQ